MIAPMTRSRPPHDARQRQSSSGNAPRPRQPGRPPTVDETALRALVRGAIQAGRLPLGGITQATGRPGAGAPCAVCAEAITADELEIRASGPSVSIVCVHARCFRIWQSERTGAS
jgi:hypothetical protein